MERTADMAGEAYIGDNPQATSDREQEAAGYRPDYTVAPPQDPDEYNWAMSGTHVAVSNDDHAEQFSAMGWNDLNRPHAFGKLELHYHWKAYWHVIYTNMSIHIVEKRLKRYSKDQGWEYGGVLDETGVPIESQALKQASVPGIGEINPGIKDWKNNEWAGLSLYDNPAEHQSDTPFYGFSDYDEDSDMTSPRTCSECGQLMLNYDDWRKHILREHVNPDRKPPGEPQPVVDLDDVLPAGFNEAIMDRTVQRQSRLIYQLTAEKPRNFIREAMGQNGDLPEGIRFEISQVTEDDADWMPADDYTDPGENVGGWIVSAMLGPYDIGQLIVRPDGVIADVDVNEQYRRMGVATGMLNALRERGVDVQHSTDLTPDGAAWSEHVGASQQLIPGPMPFIYDIESDRIFVGHPGERHSDIKGRFTPGGIIEGVYDPKGNVQIRTDTDMPYTVRHMAELWYALHPELQIKSIYLMVGTRKYRLASANIGHQVRNLAATDPAAWSVFKALEAEGGNVYAVGGCVRDIVLGKTPKDVDLMVQGVDPEDVEHVLKKLPGRVDFTGKQFGVFRYRDPDGHEVEVALPRTERSTGPGHRDFEVVTSPYISVGEDLARRDFTGNAMAVNLSTGDLIDPYRGSEDLKSGILRTVSDRSFLEDPLRILRAFGSVSRHGLDPSTDTYHDLAAHASLLKELPPERMQAELDKIMGGDDPAKAIDLMEATGVLEHVLPDVAATTGFDQKSKYHQLLLNDHLKEVLRLAASRTNDVDVRWAALLHDIGKPGSQWFDEEGYGHYYKNEHGEGEDHEELGATMAERLLTELRFPNDRIQRITHLIRHHMFPPFSAPQGARKFLNRVGDEHADDLLALRWADSGGKDKGNDSDGSVTVMGQLVNGVRTSREPTNVSQLAINGNDLIQAGFKPGPEMGQLLRHLTDLVIEDPSLNNRETLLAMAQDGMPPEPVAKTANILDPIKDTLDPDVFNNADSISPTVKPMIVNWIKKKVYKTMTDAGWPDPSKYLRLILTGSLTTYQWSEQSDFDISLWVDVERFPEWVRADLIALMIEHCDGTVVPGTTHVLQDFVVDVERFKPSDLYKPGMRSAYDLDSGEWLVLPEKERSVDVSKKWPEHIAYARGVVDKMKMMLRYDKYAVGTYWDFLHSQRRRDQMAGKGDYALSNIVYKMMENEGLFPLVAEVTGKYIA